MIPDLASAAGAIRVRLDTRQGRVVAASIASSRRPDLARRLFVGRRAEDLLETLPLVFSVCATAQATAAVRACEQAAGIDTAAPQERARELLVLAETAREHLWRILQGWSDWLGTPPRSEGMAAVGRMRGAWHQALYPLCDGFRLGGGRLQPDRAASRQLLAEMTAAIACALGTDPQAWLEMDSEEEVEAWQGAGDAPAQRLLREVGERGWAAVGTSPLRPLPPLPADVLERLLADGAAERFAALPEWESQPRETGALARSAGHPLIAAQGLRGGGRLFTRLLARLVELAGLPGRVRALLEGLEADSAPAPAEVRDGVGLAQVEAARGRLIHWVRLRSGQVADYRVVAPTEWNFHPRGGLAADLAALAADTDLPRLARLLVDAVDPCVDCRIEVTADA